MTEPNPAGLYIAGNAGLLDTPLTDRIAIIGARACSNYGESVATELGRGIARAGRIIVSGAAYGIDAAAHRAALAEGMPTIAVLACGVDRAYPSGHAEMLREIVRAGGAIVSEYEDGASPTRGRFIERNKVIARISAATIVVEAGWRSGAVCAAVSAIALGRAVGAVPGPVTSATSHGCHRLISEGARLIASVDDVLALAGVGDRG